MRPSRKVVITCAVTGSIHTPTMSPHLPVTPADITNEAVAAAEAGAAVLHLHARDPADGRPSPDPGLFMEFLPRIKQQTDAIINITTGGGPGMTMTERLAAAHRAKPEMTSLNMGTLNFGVFGLAEKYSEWRHDWEKPFLESTRHGFQSNTFAQIEEVMTTVGQSYGTRFEFECYDVGHLYTLAHFANRGLVAPPFFIQFIFGVLGGIGADYENLITMKTVADRLFSDAYYMSAFAIGRDQMRFAVQSALMGGNVRVGLEDNLFISRGVLARSNADQVRKIRGVIEDMGLEVASPTEAREQLCLKGGDKVDF